MKYVLMNVERSSQRDYNTNNDSIETIGRMGHFTKDLSCVMVFDTKQEAWAHVAYLRTCDSENGKRKNWQVISYTEFEGRVFIAYMELPEEKRGELVQGYLESRLD